jgi:hypothetical protein
MSFLDGVRDGLRDAWENIVEFTPRLIGALLILLIGWLLSILIRSVLRRVLDRIGFDRLLERAGMGAALREGDYSASGIVAGIVYWIALLITFLLAAEALQVEELSNLLAALIAYLPLVIVAIIILVVAAALGAFLADLVRPWAEQRGVGWLAPVARWAVLVFAVVAAFNTLNLAEEVVNTVFVAVVGAAAVALAIAFGVGGIDTAREYWRRMAARAEAKAGGPTTPAPTGRTRGTRNDRS